MIPINMNDKYSYGLLKNDQKFLNKVYKTNHKIYIARLKSINMVGFNRVLDAGCGFGQWSVALSDLNKNVIGIDNSIKRVGSLTRIVKDNELKNISLSVALLEKLPYARNSFDAIFSYSVIYHTDHSQSIKEISRVLKKDGLLYINFNGIGWFLYLLIIRGVFRFDLKNIKKSLYALLNTLLSKKETHAINRRKLFKILENNGFKIIKWGGDGDINMSDCVVTSFYKKKYFGLDGVVEVLAVKI